MYIWHDILLRDPLHLLLLLMIPFIILWRRRARARKGDVGIIFPSDYDSVPKSWRTRLYNALNPLFYVSLGLIILSIARPQKEHVEETVKGEGIDIFLVMDVSSSMLARDFNPDRLSVSKRVAIDFVSRRTYDRIGLAVFAGESYTQCPLTHDHRVLSEYLQNLQCGLLEDGTAIGMGLAAAVNRLKDSEAVSKVVVLLTDGVNNAGYIRPATASDVAREFGIKVYTIGVGSYGQAMSPVRRRADGEYLFGLTNVEIDEELLTAIAEQTGGKYYRAISEESLQRIYDEIDQLEKTQVDITAFRRVEEIYYYPLSAGLLLFGLLFLLRSTVLRTLPY
jgi:Ca-activated chloride channel family protein